MRTNQSKKNKKKEKRLLEKEESEVSGEEKETTIKRRKTKGLPAQSSLTTSTADQLYEAYVTVLFDSEVEQAERVRKNIVAASEWRSKRLISTQSELTMLVNNTLDTSSKEVMLRVYLKHSLAN